VLVLQNGRPLAIPWAAEHVPAILEAWYPGEAGGRAIAETLFGDNNPAGRLPISFPRRVGQLPVNYNHYRSKGTEYVDGDDSPQFVFGHGLSYTKFAYDSLRVEAPAAGSSAAVRVSFRVTNTGARAGEEVVQLYVHRSTASVATPQVTLQGFERIHLQPYESRRVTLQLPQEELAIWGAERAWQVEPGEYEVSVGGSSAAPLSTKFEL
jgi:beta-glucosidase